MTEGKQARPAPVPDLDWDAGRSERFLGAAAALWLDFLRALPALPVAREWKPGDVEEGVAMDIPQHALSDDELFDHLRAVMFDLSVYPGHPRFMGYITGAGTIPGSVADLLASVLNQNLGGWRLSPAATEIERRLTRWFATRFGLPAAAGGLITTGGAMATFTCLKVARDRTAGWDVRSRGLAGGPRLVVYASSEAHAVVRRAADMLGLGMDAVRIVPVDGAFRMRPEALRATVAADRLAGLRPIAVVATAGTTSTGAIDPLAPLAAIAREERLWFHVDAAYGGAAALVPSLRPSLDGIEGADSIAFDPHKWLSTPQSGGCALFRDITHAFDSFHVDASYTVEDRERTGSTFDFGSHGPQWSRGFAALKIWVSLLAHGEDAYARRIAHDCELAAYMGRLVEEHPALELVTPVSLSICCFRFVPPDVDGADASRDEYLDRLNERLMTDLQLDGRAYLSNAIVRGRFVLRACIVNFRTEAPDVDALLEAVVDIGGRIHDEHRTGWRNRDG